LGNILKSCLIIPCYNEERRLKLDVFKKFIESDPDISFLFVNDGSSDNTKKILEEFSNGNSNVYFLDLKNNCGKAEAVRQGMLKSLSLTNNGFKYVGYWDADLATPLEESIEFLEIAEKFKFDLVLGARVLRMGGKIYRKTSRHILGRLFATIASFLLKIPVYDTQCGAKIFKVEIIENLFKEKFISYWIFDVELLFRMNKMYGNKRQFLKSVYEHPLSYWNDKSGSKVGPLDFLKAPFELIKIYFKYK
jgi:glycosyltransferase involved in cell wall biosynthesis